MKKICIKNNLKFKIFLQLNFFKLRTELVYSLSCETGLLQVDFYSHKVLFT